MSKRPSDPVRKLGTPSEPHTGVQKKPKLPHVKPTKVRIVPAGTPIKPNWDIPR
jgi:hypothetical protein